MRMNGIFNGRDSIRNSRFQVTPSINIGIEPESESSTTATNNNNSSINNNNNNNHSYNNNNFNDFEFRRNTVPGTGTISQIDYTNDDQSTIIINDDQFNEPLFENVIENCNNNTVTTTSSTNSFYNTIYKYRKLNQNDDYRFDPVYFPMYIRRPSTGPHSAFSFHNERVLVYNFLQRPTGPWAVGYHVFISIAVIFCLILTIISTTKKYGNSFVNVLVIIDYLIITFFIVEFLARIWSSECVSYYQGWRGKVRFFKNPFRMIDLCVIIISVVVLVSNVQGELLITALRGARFISIFQMVRLDFKFRPWRMMASVVYSQRIHLAIVFYMGFLALICISFIIYFVEKDQNEDFESLASSMWWAVITLCTIGYGDMYPKTSTGKLLACIGSLIGVSIFALPAGILGTGLALKVQEQQRQLKISKRKQPAARLIQCAWRLYRTQKEMKEYRSDKYNLNIKESFNIPCRSVIWKRFESNKNKSHSLNYKEKNGLRFLFAVKFCIAKRDFVRAFKPYDIKDVLEQYAAGHADMLAKIRMMDHRLEKIQANSSSVRAQHEIKFSFANHLSRMEFELQKMQININDLTHYQLESRQIIENLLKYLLDQQRLLYSNSLSAMGKVTNIENRTLPTNVCGICFDTKHRMDRISGKFEELNLITKINQTIETLNRDLLTHVKTEQYLPCSFHNNNNNNHHYCRSPSDNNSSDLFRKRRRRQSI